MERSAARRVIDAGTLAVAATIPFALVAVVRLAPPVRLADAGLGWVPSLAAGAVSVVGALLTVAALVVGIRRGSVSALVGGGAAAAVAGAALAHLLTGRSDALAVALPVAAVLGGAAVLVSGFRPTLPGRRNRALVAAGGLLAAEVAILAGVLLGVADAMAPARGPLLAGAATAFAVVALVARDRWHAATAAAAALGAGALAADRAGSLEAVLGLGALAAAGLIGVRAAAGERPTRSAHAGTEGLPSLAAHLADGVLSFDGRLTLRDWNPAAAALLGLDDDAAGTHLSDLLGVSVGELPTDDRPRIVASAVGHLEVRLYRAGDGLVALIGSRPDRPDAERVGRELRGTIEELVQARRTIELQRGELERLASVDLLTGIATRSAVLERLRAELAQARRYAHPVAVLLLDVDGFAEINARHGVSGGDALLREVALRMRLRVREADALGRAGGDAFLAVLPHTDEAGAAIFADALRRRLAERPLPLGGDLVPVTVSVGVAVIRPGEALDLDGALALAGEALESARAAGGDRIALDRLHGLARLDEHGRDDAPGRAEGTT